MRSIKSLFVRSTLFLAISLIAGTAFAQDATGTAKTVPSSNNLLAILMAIVALLLAFVIWGLGQVLVAMGRQALDKTNQHNKIITAIMLVGLSCSSLVTSAQNNTSPEIVQLVPNYGGVDSTTFWILVAVLITELIVIAFMMFSIRRIQVELLPKTEKTKMLAIKQLWLQMDKKIFTRAVAVEKEADVMLDHNYDGIRELDNALPPWWKYGFIITIVVAFVYLLNFHVLGYGKNPTEEYQEEIAKAAQAKEVYESKSPEKKIDETNLKMPTAEGLNAGKEIFSSVCWACHGKQGEGGTGPNLIDDYWIHKGSLSDIYQSIKRGYPDKGMQSWEKNFSPNEINDLAGYIITLKGTNPPNQKAAQGDIYKDTAIADTITTVDIKKDTTITKK